MFRGSELEAGIHKEHLRKLEQQKAKGSCEWCGSEWPTEEEDPNQLKLKLEESPVSPLPPR